MIIKRNLKSEMPSLKRSRLGDSEDDESATRKKKKRRNDNGSYPLSLLAGVIPGSLPGLLGATATTEAVAVVSSSDKGGSTAQRRGGGAGEEKKNAAARPALVRTSRGRAQVLPSRFNDSVIENWRKDGKSSDATGFGDHEFEEFSFGPARSGGGKGKNGERITTSSTSHRPRGYSVLCEEVLHKNFDAASKRLSLREVFVESKCNKGVLKEEKKEGLYGPEDFYAGDIVWAKARKKEPFWPAIVIDPLSQAPELVLRSCIADAACVMFLGYFGNENQRVYLYLFTVN